MTKSEFNTKFNEIHTEFFKDSNTEQLFMDILEDKQYSIEELMPKIIYISHQLSSKFTFEVLSNVLEFDKE